GDYSHFLGWTRTLVRHNVSFETTVYEEYEKATQRNNQSPVDFDAYLSSIERELPEVPDLVQANRFYAKLNEDVVNQIKISGLQTLPNTRTGMVALAQRVWEGLRPKRSVPVSEVKNGSPSTSSGQGQRLHQRNKFHNGRPGRQWSKDIHKSGGNDNSGNRKRTESDNKKEKTLKTDKREQICYSCGQAGHIKKFHNGRPGRQWSKDIHKSGGNDNSGNRKRTESDNKKEKTLKTDKREQICYSCGQAGHIKPDCPRKDEQTTPKLKARVQQQRVVKPKGTTSDDDSSENE
ncbi:hypothetical protein V1525DRAFT_174909, partial [Lipomyces kononenkoae]